MLVVENSPCSRKENPASVSDADQFSSEVIDRFRKVGKSGENVSYNDTILSEAVLKVFTLPLDGYAARFHYSTQPGVEGALYSNPGSAARTVRGNLYHQGKQVSYTVTFDPASGKIIDRTVRNVHVEPSRWKLTKFLLSPGFNDNAGPYRVVFAEQLVDGPAVVVTEQSSSPPGSSAHEVIHRAYISTPDGFALHENLEKNLKPNEKAQIFSIGDGELKIDFRGRRESLSVARYSWRGKAVSQLTRVD